MSDVESRRIVMLAHTSPVCLQGKPRACSNVSVGSPVCAHLRQARYCRQKHIYHSLKLIDWVCALLCSVQLLRSVIPVIRSVTRFKA